MLTHLQPALHLFGATKRPIGTLAVSRMQDPFTDPQASVVMHWEDGGWVVTTPEGCGWVVAHCTGGGGVVHCTTGSLVVDEQGQAGEGVVVQPQEWLGSAAHKLGSLCQQGRSYLRGRLRESLPVPGSNKCLPSDLPRGSRHTLGPKILGADQMNISTYLSDIHSHG